MIYFALEVGLVVVLLLKPPSVLCNADNNYRLVQKIKQLQKYE